MSSVSMANYIIYGLILGLLLKTVLKVSDVQTIKFILISITTFFVVDTLISMGTDKLRKNKKI